MPPPLKGIVFRLIHNPGRYIPLCTDYSLCRGSFPCNWPWVFAQPKLDGSGSVFALWPSAVPCSPFSDPVTEVQRQRLNVSLSNTHINQSAHPPSSFHIPLLRNVEVVCRKKIVIIITRPAIIIPIHPSVHPSSHGSVVMQEGVLRWFYLFTLTSVRFAKRTLNLHWNTSEEETEPLNKF